MPKTTSMPRDDRPLDLWMTTPRVSCQNGFTIIELVVTLMLVGVLAVAILPKFAVIDSFDSAGFADQVQSILRYGQKTAVAQRRNVAVTYSATAASLCSYDGAVLSGCGATCAGGSNVTGVTLPGGRFQPARSATVTAGTVCFDAVGKSYQGGAALAATLSIVINDGGVPVRTIRVEPETGYVH